LGWVALLGVAATGCLAEIWGETDDFYPPELNATSDGEALVPALRYAVPAEWAAVSTGLSAHLSSLRLDYEIEVVEGEAGSAIPVELDLVADDRDAWAGARDQLTLRPEDGITQGSLHAHRDERSCDDMPCVDWFELRVMQPTRTARAMLRLVWRARYRAVSAGESWAQPDGAMVELLAREPP
jgi:hypothetical protein